jgi:Rod binding domain-containing protein
MDINPLQSRHIDLSNVPLERLATSTQIDQKDKIAEVSRAFEAVLLRQILQESQKPSFKSKLSGDSATDGIYHDMVVNQLAESISKSGSFGLAKHLAGQLQRQAGAAKSHTPSALAQPSATADVSAVSVRAPANGRKMQPLTAGAPLATSAKSAAPTHLRAGKPHFTPPHHE